MIKRCQLKWYGHISKHDSLSKAIMQVMVEGSRKRGRQRSKWFHDISEWTKMDVNQILHKVHDRDGWRQFFVKAEITTFISPMISESQD